MARRPSPALFAVALLALQAPSATSAAAAELCGAAACWTVSDPVRCADNGNPITGVGTSPLLCQWQITNPDNVMMSAYELTDFPKADPSTGLSNGFFSASQYQVDCSQPVYFVNRGPTPIYGPLGSISGYLPSVQDHICSVVSAPVVDASFLQQLSAAGLFYKVVYPIKDNGNGHAYVVWSGINYWNHSGWNTASVAGYARITGVTWRDQFQTYSSTTPAVWNLPASTKSIPSGDVLGAGTMIDAMPSPQRETTIRLGLPMLTSLIGPEMNGYYYTVLTDSWLGDTVTLPPVQPPTPLTPPTASTQTPAAGAVNIGAASTSAAGTADPGGVGFTTHDGGFDWASYCNGPGPAGQARTPLWIASCLEAAQP